VGKQNYTETRCLPAAYGRTTNTAKRKNHFFDKIVNFFDMKQLDFIGFRKGKISLDHQVEF